MARSSTGKSVARAAATGGGTTYRGQMPVNWYAALVLIVLLGIGSVVVARYHYTHGSTSTTQPTVGQTWHAALAFDICGTVQPALAASGATTTTGLTSSGNGVLLIAPKTSSEAGNNAALGKFASEYTGMTLTDTAVKYPVTTDPKYTNGETCPKGTPDAGKKGVVRARSWTLSSKSSKNGELEQVGGAYAKKPPDLKLLNRQLITVAFVPANVALPKVPATTELDLLQTIEGTAPATTTTVAPSTATTTTAPVATTATTTTKPSATTTTTKPSATTTTKPTSTTTTKPS
jgi:hypothetical protein